MRSAQRRVVFTRQNAPDRVKRAAKGKVSMKRRSRKSSSASPKDMAAGDDSRLLDIPQYFSNAPVIKDSLVTATSSAQVENLEECLPLLTDPWGVPRLDRDQHIEFLRAAIEEFPAKFVGVDASRPWMVYWGLTGLSLLGEDVTSYRTRVIKTFTPTQYPTGGIGGGHGQYPHLAGSYAAILSIATVGGDATYSCIHRKTMWHWLGRLKQVDGGFQLCEGGEEDTRGALCAMVMLSLLNLPFVLPPDAPARQAGLETFGDGLGTYISRCQTYEGGISDAPGSEAHGAYTFCALACLCLLGEPHVMMERYLDVPALVYWLASRQYAPEGGFAGRTNKLVDGCYCHWAGGCFPLVQAALVGPRARGEASASPGRGSLSNREGHTRYILSCCQSENGGLRDKPSKHPDSYHTCYTLAGLSSVQHEHYYQSKADASEPFASASTWDSLQIHASAAPDLAGQVFDEEDRLQPLHPVYVIPHKAVADMRSWAEKQPIDF